MLLRRAFVLGASTLSLVLYACTGENPNLSASESDSGATSDATGGGGDTDTATDSGAGTDAPQDAGPTWCASQTGHDFCADFDRDPFDDGWVRFENMGVVAANQLAFVSGPRAADCTVNAGTGTSTTPLRGAIGHILTETPATFEARFSMRIRTSPTFGASDRAVVAIVSAGDTNFVFLQFDGTGFALIAGTVTDSGLNVAPVSAAAKLDEWVEVRLRGTFSTDPNVGYVELSFDGTVVAEKKNIATVAGPMPDTVAIGLGPTIYEHSPGLVVAYDNVLFDNVK